ncbi:MAG: CinA family protein [Campylobacterota bacterium]|nr:CinA family protein [Campylobacterota bacterium]
MSIALVYIDHSLYQNSALTLALQRKLEAKNKSLKAIHYLKYNDATLINSLQNILQSVPQSISNKTREFCIAASAEAYPLVSRIVATLSGDDLIATGSTLHPASAIRVENNSYLLRLNDTICNVLLLRSDDKLPEVLLETGEEFTTWQLFGNRDYLHALRQHARDSQYHFEYFQVIDDWYEICTQATYPMEKFLTISPDSDLILFPSKNIFDTCIKVLEYKGKTITFAESCTGGLIASSFTARSGSSTILMGSVVSYANGIKHQWLNVDNDILENHGAVSQECVSEMAKGARRLAKSDIALATSGIAGPTGGTLLKPVGTVYIAASNSKETRVKHLLLKGDRNYIQHQAVMHSIRQMILLEKKNFEEFFRNA